jgi:AraC-like DNA-binding protein
MKSLIETLLVLSAVNGLFIATVLFMKRGRRGENRILSVFLFMIALHVLMRLCSSKGLGVLSYSLSLISLPAMAVSGCVIWFYVRVMTSDESHPRINPLHLIPAAVVFVLYGALNLLMCCHYGTEFIPGHIIQHLKWFIMLIVGYSAVSGAVYTFDCWKMIHSFSEQALDYFSDIQSFRLSWLRVVLVLIVAMFIVMGGFYLIDLSAHGRLPLMGSFSAFLSAGVSLSVVFSTSYFAMVKPDVFREKEIIPESSSEFLSHDGKNKYQKQNLDEETAHRYQHLLVEFMKERKPYLEEKVTLKRIADSLSIPSHHLSIVINQYEGKNFYTFINSYRIEEAKVLLLRPENGSRTIYDIALDAGFNSKSAFNNIFRLMTGMTPGEFRSSNASFL